MKKFKSFVEEKDLKEFEEDVLAGGNKSAETPNPDKQIKKENKEDENV